jgi:hypothetical protein
LPALLALLLTAVHWVASRSIWPAADVTLTKLAGQPWGWPFVALLAAGMIGVDVYCTFVVGEVDQKLLQQYFDQAEYWLRSWTAPVVHVLTLGAINPREMVAVEVRKALREASRLLNANLWWLAAQIGVRFAFGLSLWLTWALANG